MQTNMHIPRNVEGGDSYPDNTKHQVHFCCNSLVDSGENGGWTYINWIVFVLLWCMNSFTPVNSVG